MMKQPPDFDARRRALDPAKSFIVQAPAGSGKTELLVRRYLTLLAHVDAPEKILAITFTKKATAEMRARVVDALKRAQNKNDADDNPELRALAAAAIKNDARHNWNLCANTRRLRIQTIDSFCTELVRRMPWSARFGAPPEIVEDAGPLHRRAAKRALDHIEDAKWEPLCAKFLQLVDANWTRARDLLADMLEKRGQWLPLGKDVDALARMWRDVIEEELQGIAARIPAEHQNQIIELAVFADANLRTNGDERLSALRDAKNFPTANAKCVEQWHALAAFLLKNDGNLKKTVTVRQGFPLEQKNEKQKMLALLKQLVAQPGIVDALNKARMLPNINFGEAESKSVAALIALLRLTASELYLLFSENNQSDFTELTQRAKIALGDEDNPSDLALMFDRRIEHLLMDEFQDTSTSHIDLLAGLTAGWQHGDGRSVFFVGDPMQSIYRFREAEVAHFLQVRKHGFGDIALESVELQSNFRSAPALVEWFNQTFRRVLPAEDNIAEGAARYTEARAHVAADSQSGAHVHAGIKREPSQEAAEVAVAIEETMQRGANQTLAVLGRTRAHLREVAAALRAREINFQAVELEKLDERPAIRDLAALTRALAQPADRIAWLSLLRAPWCGMTLDDITALAGGDFHAPLPELWRDETLCAALSTDGRARLQRMRDAVKGALARRGRIGMRQNVESAWLALGGPATLTTPDLDDCHRYLDLLDELEDRRIEITAANIKTATENLWARPHGDARAQLLTIHKAKGLEFDHVFLPGLGRAAPRSDKELLRWQKLPGQLLIAPLPASIDTENPFYRYLAHLDKVQQQNEAGRLLYVACTRARKTLHLFGGVGKNGAPASSSLLALLWPQVSANFEINSAADNAADDTAGDDFDAARMPQALQKLPRDWSPPQLPPGIDGKTAARTVEHEEIEFSWASEIARATGVVIHEILQRIDSAESDAAQAAVWRGRLAQQGVPEDKLDDALARVTTAINNARQDKRADWIFSRAHRDIRAEWPLTGIIDGAIRHVVIDRAFVDENDIRWIVDFKSSRHEGADIEEFLDRELERHRGQLEAYTAVVGQFETRQVRVALYFPALCGWREMPK